MAFVPPRKKLPKVPKRPNVGGKPVNPIKDPGWGVNLPNDRPKPVDPFPDSGFGVTPPGDTGRPTPQEIPNLLPNIQTNSTNPDWVNEVISANGAQSSAPYGTGTTPAGASPSPQQPAQPVPMGGNRNSFHEIGGPNQNFGIMAGKGLNAARTAYSDAVKAGVQFGGHGRHSYGTYSYAPTTRPNAAAMEMMRATALGLVRGPSRMSWRRVDAKGAPKKGAKATTHERYKKLGDWGVAPGNMGPVRQWMDERTPGHHPGSYWGPHQKPIVPPVPPREDIKQPKPPTNPPPTRL